MYQEMKSDSLAQIFQTIAVTLNAEENTSVPVSVTLYKRGKKYEATLVQAEEPSTA